jgi:hypothetical protein
MPRTLSYTFAVTIPAGTLPSAPLVTPTQFETNELRRVEWVFPGGCNGVVGIQIGARSVPVLPSSPAQFHVRSGAAEGLDVSEFPNTGDWSVIGYNTGSFPHTIQVTFHVARIEPQTKDAFLINDTTPYLQMGEG